MDVVIQGEEPIKFLVEIDSIIQRISSSSRGGSCGNGEELKLIFHPLCPQCVEEQLPGNQPFSRIDETKIPMIEIDSFKELQQRINSRQTSNNNTTDNDNERKAGSEDDKNDKDERKRRACGGSIRSHWLKTEDLLFGIPSPINHSELI